MPLRLLIGNVRVGTRDPDRLFQLIEQKRPDILLLVETDAWWDDALTPVVSQFKTSLRYPREDGYGMHFFTNLPAEAAELRFLLEPEIPSVRAQLTLPNGESMIFLGLHPQPPVPNFKNTKPRDAELLLAGREASESGLPTVIAGDLNDVAWSRTTRLLMRTTNLLDPRRGRGIYATFPVPAPWLRWPLDHIFHTAHFSVRSLIVEANIGSDHFPVYVVLCREQLLKQRQDNLNPKNGDCQEVQEVIKAGVEKAEERDGPN